MTPSMATTRPENSKKRKAEDEDADPTDCDCDCASPDCPLYEWQRQYEQPLDITSSAVTKAVDREGLPETLYRPLKEWQTRVLFLESGKYGEPLKAQLRVVDLLYDSGGLIHGTDDRVEYSALSYCWGSPELICSIWCNGEDFHITEAAYRALQRLRQTDSTFAVWIDAICVNQLDTTERSQQVSKMLTIYKKAESVITDGVAWGTRQKHDAIPRLCHVGQSTAKSSPERKDPSYQFRNGCGTEANLVQGPCSMPP